MHTFRANQGRREAGAGDSGHEEDGRYNDSSRLTPTDFGLLRIL